MNPLDPRVIHYAPEAAPLVALLAVVNAAEAALVVVHALERVEGCPSTEVRLARHLRAALARSSRATHAYSLCQRELSPIPGAGRPGVGV